MRITFVLLIFLFLLGISFSALADIDRRCMTLCHDTGKTPKQCLAQCTYNLQKNLIDAQHSQVIGNSHQAFVAPKPVSSVLLPSTAPGPTVFTGKDFKCVSLCLQKGMQYELCNEACTKVNCTSVSSLCRDLNSAGPDVRSLTSTPH